MNEKQVKDLMVSLSEYATIPAESTIKEALRALDKAQLGLTEDRHHHRAVLVLDEGGAVVGKLSHWALLRRLEPKFFNADDRQSLARAGLTLEFINSIQAGLSGYTGSLPTMCREAAHIKVRDAMVPVDESIDEEETLASAIHQLVVSHVQSMLVTRAGQTVGILRLSDVFEEVAELIRASDSCA